MATLAPDVRAHPLRTPTRQRVKDFGRGLTYQIAGLPIAVRNGADRPFTSPHRVLRHAYARRYWSPRNWSERVQLMLALIIWPFVLLALQIAFTLKNGGQ